MSIRHTLFLLIAGFFISTGVFAQCDTIAELCEKHITSDFISDGQQYRALLRNDEIAEFEVTLYGGSTYRVSACSGFNDGNLIFTLLDQERNVLFANNEFQMAPYWDFQVAYTMDCIIEAKLKPSESESGCAVLLMGFKQ